MKGPAPYPKQSPPIAAMVKEGETTSAVRRPQPNERPEIAGSELVKLYRHRNSTRPPMGPPDRRAKEHVEAPDSPLRLFLVRATDLAPRHGGEGRQRNKHPLRFGDPANKEVSPAARRNSSERQLAARIRNAWLSIATTRDRRHRDAISLVRRLYNSIFRFDDEDDSSIPTCNGFSGSPTPQRDTCYVLSAGDLFETTLRVSRLAGGPAKPATF